MATEITYEATPTLSRFHQSDARRRGILGPVGSGKSTACCWEIWKRGHEQAPGPRGVRRTRFAVTRSTYRELKDTTLQTWLDWFGATGRYVEQDHTFRVRDEQTHIEILFRSLDRPADVQKLLSLELTGAWVNEARETPWGLIEALDDRLGRYPAVKDGGCTWSGLIMDTNPPDDDHWWYRLAEEQSLESWQFFRQPGGLVELGKGHDTSGEVVEYAGTRFAANPAAENTEHLEPRYYLDRIEGKSLDHIRVYYCAEYGFVRDGKPVFSEYRDQVHCPGHELTPDPSRTLYVGIDFGLTPAAIFGQRTVTGQWRWVDELVTEDMGTVRFAELLGARLRGEYEHFRTEIYGDPAGDQRAQTDERTPFQILRAAGIEARPASTNDFMLRREAVAVPMNRMIDGEPGFLISPRCRVARKGLAGGYCYKRIQVSGTERYHDRPDKNRFSHPLDAGQYMHIGAGEGRTIIRGPRKKLRLSPSAQMAADPRRRGGQARTATAEMRR